MRASSRPGSACTTASCTSRGQAHRQAIDIDLVDVRSFRFEKDLMALLVRKAHYFVLKRWTVAWTDARDLPVVERRAADVRADQIVDAAGRVDEMTGNLRPFDSPGHERKRHDGSSPCSAGNREKSIVRRSSRGGVPVFRRPISKPIACSESARSLRRRLVASPGGPLLLANVHETIQERACRDDERVTGDLARHPRSEVPPRARGG